MLEPRTWETLELGGGEPYRMPKLGGKTVGGVMQMGDGEGGMSTIRDPVGAVFSMIRPPDEVS